MNANSCPRGVPVHPINAYIALGHLDKLVGNDPQRRFAHSFPSTVILSQGIVEGDFFIAEAGFLAIRRVARMSRNVPRMVATDADLEEVYDSERHALRRLHTRTRPPARLWRQSG